MLSGIGTEENIFLSCVATIANVAVQEFSVALRASENRLGHRVVHGMSWCPVLVEEKDRFACVLFLIEAGHIGFACFLGDFVSEGFAALGASFQIWGVMKVVTAKRAALAIACAGPEKDLGIVFAAATLEWSMTEWTVINRHDASSLDVVWFLVKNGCSIGCDIKKETFSAVLGTFLEAGPIGFTALSGMAKDKV